MKSRILCALCAIAMTTIAARAADSDRGDPANIADGRMAVMNPIPGDPVAIDTGRVSGTLLASGVRAYFGIPFAAPPIRRNRWRAPQPPKPWSGILTADKMPAECVQGLRNNNIDHYFTDEDDAEDCLYLNIWEPATGRAGAKLPVIVWIYGGGFNQGSSSMPIYGGQNLVKKGIIYVAVNYRVGIFGFMAHPEATKESGHNASGNWGFLDQVAGLKWVQRNIAAFGGDPGNVTIVGQSAGAMSINNLQASPLTRGLFQKAAGWSGATVAPTNYPGLAQGEAQGTKLQAAMKVGSLNDMRAFSSDKVAAAAAGVRAAPIVDGYFLPKSPEAIFEAGEQNDVPIIVGSTTNDLGTDIPVGKAATLADFKAAATQMYGDKAPEFLAAYPARTDAQAAAMAKLASKEAGLGLGDRNWAKLQSTTGKQPAYMYLFDRLEPFTPGVAIADNPQARGVYHTTDIEYWLQNQDTLNMLRTTRDWTPYDRQLSDIMSDIFVNFAKTGTPSAKGAALMKYNPRDERETVFGNEIHVEKMNSKGMDFMTANPPARRQGPGAALTGTASPASASY